MLSPAVHEVSHSPFVAPPSSPAQCRAARRCAKLSADELAGFGTDSFADSSPVLRVLDGFEQVDNAAQSATAEEYAERWAEVIKFRDNGGLS